MPVDDGRLPETLVRLRQYQRIILALGRFVTTDPPIQQFLDETVRQISRATEIDHVKVLRYRPELGDFLVVAGVGWKPGVVGMATLPIGVSSPPGRVIQTGQPTTIRNILEDPEYLRSSILEEHDIVSLINVPVTVDAVPWGVLEVDCDEPKDFTEDIMLLLETAALLITSVIQRQNRARAATQARADVAAEADRRMILLRELNHRSKNNLQIITSMIMLQRRKVQSDETKHVLRVLADRVAAVGLTQDQLDPQKVRPTVSTARYLTALCHTFGDLAGDVVIDTDVDDIGVPMETAVPLGLIVNELVTNAAKHAFDGGGRVSVKFKVRADYEACLSVSDDGKGMTKTARPGSFGVTLVQTLTSQLRGRIDWQRQEKGTLVRLLFYLPRHGITVQ